MATNKKVWILKRTQIGLESVGDIIIESEPLVFEEGLIAAYPLEEDREEGMHYLYSPEDLEPINNLTAQEREVLKMIYPQSVEAMEKFWKEEDSDTQQL